MTASEAREIAQLTNFSKYFTQYDKIIDQVKNYAKGGFFEIAYYEEILPSVKEKLLEDGFIVTKTPDGRNGFDIKISWDELPF